MGTPINNYKNSGLSKDDYVRSQKTEYLKHKGELPTINPIKKVRNWFRWITDRDTWSRYGMRKPDISGDSTLNKGNLRYRIRNKINKMLTPKGMFKAAKTAASIAAVGIAGKYILDRRRENKAYHHDMANRMFGTLPIHKSGYSNPYLKGNEKLLRGTIVRG